MKKRISAYILLSMVIIVFSTLSIILVSKDITKFTLQNEAYNMVIDMLKANIENNVEHKYYGMFYENGGYDIANDRLLTSEELWQGDISLWEKNINENNDLIFKSSFNLVTISILSCVSLFLIIINSIKIIKNPNFIEEQKSKHKERSQRKKELKRKKLEEKLNKL